MKGILTWILCLTIVTTNGQINVSSNGRFLQTKNGEPFFWLGDTDWELFHRITREEAVEFIDIRSEQGYNVLQAVMTMTGIRTAAVINVGTATLAAFIDTGGLGEFIVTGLALNNSELILRGAVPAALLALSVEIGFSQLEKRFVLKHLRNTY